MKLTGHWNGECTYVHSALCFEGPTFPSWTALTQRYPKPQPLELGNIRPWEYWTLSHHPILNHVNLGDIRPWEHRALSHGPIIYYISLNDIGP